MVLEVLIISLIIIGARGSLGYLNQIKMNWTWPVILAFLVQGLLYFLAIFTDGGLANTIRAGFGYINLASYLVLIIFVGLNLKLRGAVPILLGLVLNFLPMLFNGGRMPVLKEALIRAGLYNQLQLLETNSIMTHSLAGPGSRLIILSDWIALPKNYIWPKIISLGDILLGLGLLWMLLHYGLNEVEDEKK